MLGMQFAAALEEFSALWKKLESSEQDAFGFRHRASQPVSARRVSQKHSKPQHLLPFGVDEIKVGFGFLA
jgi:hypothetical protein